MKHKQQILALRAEGKTYNEIKDILGCSKGTIAYHLGEGQRDKSIERQASRRQEIYNFLYEYKESVGCVDCGEKYPYYVLQFDHLYDKEFALSHFASYTGSLDKVRKEVEKCDVVCANCHSMRTYARKDNVNNKRNNNAY